MKKKWHRNSTNLGKLKKEYNFYQVTTIKIDKGRIDYKVTEDIFLYTWWVIPYKIHFRII